jgi:hypothetical protein
MRYRLGVVRRAQIAAKVGRALHLWLEHAKLQTPSRPWPSDGISKRSQPETELRREGHIEGEKVTNGIPPTLSKPHEPGLC